MVNFEKSLLIHCGQIDPEMVFPSWMKEADAGANGEIWTRDLLITNEVLYP